MHVVSRAGPLPCVVYPIETISVNEVEKYPDDRALGPQDSKGSFKTFRSSVSNGSKHVDVSTRQAWYIMREL